MKEKVLVIGTGEIGAPLLELIRNKYEAYGLDIAPVESIPQCDIVHICFPFTDADRFVAEVVRYIKRFGPSLTVVNSTVAPGITRRIATEAGAAVVNSPIRGKHARMKAELLEYTKFIGALDAESGQRAAAHFAEIGMRTKVLSSPEASELAKLTETTYFGVLIAWAQEVERYCKAAGADYEEVVSFYDEIRFFPPVKYFPGVIGGHCVMPNIKILRKQFASAILEAVEQSNDMKQKGQGF